MALTPDYDVSVPDLFSSTDEVSRTYKVDWDAGEIIGVILAEDSEQAYLEAIKQFVFKALQSRRFVNIVYTPDYGSELEEMQKLGYSRELIQTETQRLIVEALIYDDRIDSVDEFSFEFNGDSMLVRFTVTTTRGASINLNQELGVT